MTNPVEGPQEWAGESPTEVIGGTGGPPQAAPAPSTSTPLPASGTSPMAAAPAAAAGPSAAEAATAVPAETSTPAAPAPTAGAPAIPRMPVSDYVRDALALLALVVSLARPWDYLHVGAGRAEVVAVTVLSLCTLLLPYLARVGVFPASWTVHTTRRVRIIGNIPYVVVALVYLVVDGISGGPAGDAGRIGTGVALGLAGAALAAQARECELGTGDSEVVTGRRWMAIAIVGAGVMAVLAIVNTVVVLVTGDFEATTIVAIVLAAILVVALVAVPLVGVLRGSAGARLTLGALGCAFGVAFLAGSGTTSFVQYESLHLVLQSAGLEYFLVVGIVVPCVGVLLLPAVAALAAAPATRSVTRPTAPAQAWLDAAVGAFTLIAAVALFALVVAVLEIVEWDVTTPRVLAIVAATLLLAVAVIGRIVLRGSGDGARRSGIVLAGLAVVVGGMLLGAMAIETSHDSDGYYVAYSAGSGAIHLVAAVGLPLFIVGALTIPASVRMRFPASPRAYTWEPPAPKPVRVAPTEYGQQPYPGGYGAAQQGPAYGPGTQGYGPQGGAPGGGYPTQAVPAASAEAYAPYAPATGAPGGAQPPHFAPAPPAAVPATEQVAGFTAEQAADPATPLEVLAQIVQDAPHLRPQVAANPATYQALLDWLGSLGDPAVDEALRSRR